MQEHRIDSSCIWIHEENDWVRRLFLDGTCTESAVIWIQIIQRVTQEEHRYKDRLDLLIVLPSSLTQQDSHHLNNIQFSLVSYHIRSYSKCYPS